MEPATVLISEPAHAHLADACSYLISQAAGEPGAALARRTPEYLKEKIIQGKAVIALGPHAEVVGFCYIEAWENEKFVSNSGLVVAPQYRGSGLARRLKAKILEVSRGIYPNSIFFGITTNKAVMQIYSNLGYEPVSFADITKDDRFWTGCESCPYHDILRRMNRVNCLCTAMLYNPKRRNKRGQESFSILDHSNNELC